MAVVERGEPRIAPKHFGLYRTSAGGDEQVIVRRKVGEPTDYMHLNSRAVLDQRNRLSFASRHWSNLKPSQKAAWRYKMAWVSKTGSPSQEVLLKGRELFISQDIHDQISTQEQVPMAFDICIILCNQFYEPLSGQLHLIYTEGGDEKSAPGMELATGNWLFPNVPPKCHPYRVWGEAEGYFDPERPEDQSMSEWALKNKHWHVLLVETEEEDKFPHVPPGEIPCCTGMMQRWVSIRGETWAALHGGEGTGGGSPTYYPSATIIAGRNTDRWRNIDRAGICIPTWDIPPSWNITQAWLNVYAYGKINTFPYSTFGLALVAFNPSDRTQFDKEDYQHFGIILCSNSVKGINQWEAGNWYSFPLNEWGIECIHKPGITCFGLREYFYDVTGTEPTWYRQEMVQFKFVGFQSEDPHWPELWVVHT